MKKIRERKRYLLAVLILFLVSCVSVPVAAPVNPYRELALADTHLASWTKEGVSGQVLSLGVQVGDDKAIIFITLYGSVTVVECVTKYMESLFYDVYIDADSDGTPDAWYCIADGRELQYSADEVIEYYASVLIKTVKMFIDNEWYEVEGEKV